jgi:hypothetical protein
MVASVTSPADQANLALVRMGYKLRVGSLYDGSFAAKKLLDVYAQTRDELLRAHDWDFAERNVALTLLKQAPVNGYIATPWNPVTNPPVGYNFEYLYPSDCLKIRAVKGTPLFVPNFDPSPNAFSPANDPQCPVPPAPQADCRVILCNIGGAIATYTGQETSPANWDVGFIEEFAAALGRHLGPVLVGMQGAQMEAADEQGSSMTAQMEQG